MSIPKNLAYGKEKTISTAKLVGFGNIMPNWCYHKVLSCGKPDFVAITVLSELLFLHRKSSELEFNNGYSYFERKFNLTRKQLQDSTLRLHNSGLVVRSFRTIMVQGRKFPNELHLKLCLDRLLDLAPSDDDHTTTNGDLAVNSLEGVFCHEVLVNLSASPSGNHKDNYIDNKDFYKKSRSNESPACAGSNFVKSDFKEVISEQETVQDNLITQDNLIKQNTNTDTAKVFTTRIFQKKPMLSFHPLTEEDACSLRRQSGREFSLHFINQLVLRLAGRYEQHGFYNKEAFLAYMAKALQAEMRDVARVNNESFRFGLEGDAGKIESYLREVEASRDVSQESQIRRKIAAVFEPQEAYRLLISIAKIEVRQQGSCLFQLRDAGFVLSDHQRQILLSQVRGGYGNHIEALELRAKGSYSALQNKSSMSKKLELGLEQEQKQELEIDGASIWGRVRIAMIGYFDDKGEDKGKWLDRTWLSQLRPQEDSLEKKLVLKAPTNFIKSYITQNYQYLIERFCHQESYQLTGLVVG